MKKIKKRRKTYRIYWHKRLKMWMVNIAYKGENIHIGYYKDLSDAIIARNDALVKLGQNITNVPKRLSKYEKLCLGQNENILSEADKKLLKASKDSSEDNGLKTIMG